MTQHHDAVDHTLRPSMGCMFGNAIKWVVICWAVAVVVVNVTVAALAPELLIGSCVISVASVLIAVASMLPGLLSGDGSAKDSSDQTIEFPRVAVTGIMLRFAGTVALFLSCRYQMAASAEMIAALTIGWYLHLTVVEVVALSRALPKTYQVERLDSAMTFSTDS